MNNSSFEKMFEGVDIDTYINAKPGEIIKCFGQNSKIDCNFKVKIFNGDIIIRYGISDLIYMYYTNTYEIPSGKRVIFIDGNKRNLKFENLRLIPSIMTEEMMNDLEFKFQYFDLDQVRNIKPGDSISLWDRHFIVYNKSMMDHINLNYYDIKESRSRTVRISIKDILSSYYEYMYYKHIHNKIS